MVYVDSKEPNQCGVFDVNTPELMFVQYMPVAIPGQPTVQVPKNLEWLLPMVYEACEYASLKDHIYVTAKRLYVCPGSSGNRPGWHTDGFGTNDKNFIWYDSNPTEFCVQSFRFKNMEDHEESMHDMEMQADSRNIITYPAKTLLQLDSSIVHRVAQNDFYGYRTFVKISISKDKYNLEGNAHNHLLDYDWKMYPREEHRNHPQVKD